MGMRLVQAGERLFVDYAGMTMPVNDPAGGESFAATIFVAALGASHYLYAEATRTQQLPDWIESHIRAFEHLGGVSAILSPDNLKSGVSRACRYEPDAKPMRRRKSAKGDFWGCSAFPGCKGTRPA